MHRLIYNALRDHDGEAAQPAMSEHLRQSQALNIGRSGQGDAAPTAFDCAQGSRLEAPALTPSHSRPANSCVIRRAYRHLGILGAGNISDTHARAAASLPNVRVAAVCGVNDARVAAHGRAPRRDAVPRPRRVPPPPAARHRRHRQPVGAARRRTSPPRRRTGCTCWSRSRSRSRPSASTSWPRRSTRAGVTLGVFFQDRVDAGLRARSSAICRPARLAGRRWPRLGLSGIVRPSITASRAGAGRGRSTAAAR